MKKFYSDWSLRQVINNCEYTDLQVMNPIPRYEESVFTFREKNFVDGRIDTFSTPDMEISMMAMNLSIDLVIRINDNIPRTVSTFVLKGRIDSAYFDSKHSFSQLPNQHSLTHGSTSHSEHIIHAGAVSLLYINYKQEFIRSLSAGMGPGAAKLSEEIRPGTLYVSSPVEFFRVSDTLKSIYSCKYKGPVKNIFIEGKALELFSFQLEELLKEPKSSDAVGINRTDQEKLILAHEFIKEQFMDAFSLKELALKFGLNEFKLKNGYKKLYGQTVFGHIGNLRMKYAGQLLETGLYNVSEVADMMGYSNAFNFSAAFTKEYGFPPRRLRKKSKTG